MFPIHFSLTLGDLIRLNPTLMAIIPGLCLIGLVLIVAASIRKFA